MADLDAQERKQVVAGSILSITSADRVLFDEDGVHVLVGPVERGGEQVVERFRLGATAQRYLSGEYGDEPPEAVTLHPPNGD